MKDTAVLRNKHNPNADNYNDLYRHVRDNTVRNLRTGVEGDISDNQLQTQFVIDYNATMLLNKYPNIEEIIFKLKLKLEHDSNN